MLVSEALTASSIALLCLAPFACLPGYICHELLGSAADPPDPEGLSACVSHSWCTLVCLASTVLEQGQRPA